MDEFITLVSDRGFAIAFGVFVCLALWKGGKFCGIRLIGENGIIPGYVSSIKETHVSLKESHQSMATSNQQTALAVVAIQKGFEEETQRRDAVDQKVMKVLDLVAEGTICNASHLIQLQMESESSYVESQSESR